MADFRPLLQRAIAGLPENTPEARQAIFSRARDALERHLASREPALEDAERLKEILALEDVIRALENDAQVAAQQDIAAQKEVVAEKETAAQPEDSFQVAGPALPVPPKPAKENEIADEPAPLVATAVKATLDLPIPETPIALKIPERLKLPEAESDAPRRKRKGLLVGFGVLAMLAVGALALTNRAGPEHYRKTTSSQSPDRVAADASEVNKREGRLSSPETPAAPRPVPAQPPSTASQTAPQNPPVSRPAQPAASLPTPAQPPLLVASRAFMILEGQGSAPDQFEGQANWSFAAESANPNGPKAVRLDVQFAAAGLKMEGSITLNADRGIDASHTILLIFEPGERLPAVREMSAIEWRERETVNGATLAGRLAPIQDNVFMIGLDANAAALQRNLDLLRNQKWLVFETRMANGRRGAFLIEKGSSGEKAISEALSVWK